MCGTVAFPNCIPARTRRGERPDKKRHPQSYSSTDVKEGSNDPTQLNITTSVQFCNTYRHQNIFKYASPVKLWLSVVQLSPFVGSPAAGARTEIAPGPPGCVIMDVLCRYLIDMRKESSMSARVPAIMLVLIVIAANQPALILHRLLEAGMALLKCLFG